MRDFRGIFSNGQLELFRFIAGRWYLWQVVHGPPQALSRAYAVAVELAGLAEASGGWPANLAGDSFYPKPPVPAITRSGTFPKHNLYRGFR